MKSEKYGMTPPGPIAPGDFALDFMKDGQLPIRPTETKVDTETDTDTYSKKNPQVESAR